MLELIRRRLFIIGGLAVVVAALGLSGTLVMDRVTFGGGVAQGADMTTSTYMNGAVAAMENGSREQITSVTVEDVTHASATDAAPVSASVAVAAAVGLQPQATVLSTRLTQVTGLGDVSSNTYYWLVALKPAIPFYPPALGIGPTPSGSETAYNVDIIYVNAYTGGVYVTYWGSSPNLPALANINFVS